MWMYIVHCMQAVTAEGNCLVDLLDNYMKKCSDKKIVPIGGVLHLVYDEAWNPPGNYRGLLIRGSPWEGRGGV